jgi:hypothetical protein
MDTASIRVSDPGRRRQVETPMNIIQIDRNSGKPPSQILAKAMVVGEDLDKRADVLVSEILSSARLHIFAFSKRDAPQCRRDEDHSRPTDAKSREAGCLRVEESDLRPPIATAPSRRPVKTPASALRRSTRALSRRLAVARVEYMI